MYVSSEENGLHFVQWINLASCFRIHRPVCIGDKQRTLLLGAQQNISPGLGGGKMAFNLRTKVLLIFLILALVPLLMIGWFSLKTTENLIVSMVVRQLENAAIDKVALLERWLDERKADMEVIAGHLWSDQWRKKKSGPTWRLCRINMACIKTFPLFQPTAVWFAAPADRWRHGMQTEETPTSQGIRSTCPALRMRPKPMSPHFLLPPRFPGRPMNSPAPSMAASAQAKLLFTF